MDRDPELRAALIAVAGGQPVAGPGVRHRPGRPRHPGRPRSTRRPGRRPARPGQPGPGTASTPWMPPPPPCRPGQTARDPAHRGPRPARPRRRRGGRRRPVRIRRRPAATGLGAGRRRSGRPGPGIRAVGWPSSGWASWAGGELNYSSDVDILLVAPTDTPAEAVRPPALPRPGPAAPGGSTSTCDPKAGPASWPAPCRSYLAYWDRWAETWEFQALLKARAVAGNRSLGSELRAGGRRPGLGPPLRRRGAPPGPPAQSPGRAGRDPAGPGRPGAETGNGRHPRHRVRGPASPAGPRSSRPQCCARPSTLAALGALADGGYVAPEDAAALEAAYRFLRTVEHRLQLYEDQQVHTLPSQPEARVRLARVLGYRDQTSGHGPGPVRIGPAAPSEPGSLDPRAALLPAPAGVVHLAATAAPATAHLLSPEAVVERLQAFGFADAERTSQAVRELTRGFSRSVAADVPDAADPAGLAVQLTRSRRRPARSADPRHRDPPPGPAHRPVPGVARSGPPAVPADRHRARASSGPSSANRTCSPVWPPATRWPIAAGPSSTSGRPVGWRGASGEGGIDRGLQLFTRAENLRIAARDALDLVDVAPPARRSPTWPNRWWTRPCGSSTRRCRSPSSAWAVSAGASWPTRSDLDLLFVYEAPAGWSAADAAAKAESVAVRPGTPARRQHPGHRPVPGRHGATP